MLEAIVLIYFKKMVNGPGFYLTLSLLAFEPFEQQVYLYYTDFLTARFGIHSELHQTRPEKARKTVIQ